MSGYVRTEDIPCDLRKLPACVKINNILKLLGVEL